MTISALQRQGPRQRYNEVLLRETLVRLLRTLDFLHTVANVVHTGMLENSIRFIVVQCAICIELISHADIKTTNIMLTVDDESMLTDFERAEQDDPAPRKVIDANRTTYCSRKFRFPKEGLWGEPVLCDFGQARIGRVHQGDIQPEIYKALEVLFEMEWSYSVDIWNVGVMVSTLLIDQYLKVQSPYCGSLRALF